MPAYFLDSSALVKRYLGEEGTPRVLEIIAGAERVVVSRLTMVEVTSATVRRRRVGDVSADLARRVLEALDEDSRQLYEVVDLAAGTIARACDLVGVHGLRAADSVQLACALLAAGGLTGGQGLIFVSADAELNAAAAAERLVVVNPCGE
ncbi:MAG TPA: type II toxin-antitoxin system VapC family toxin [Phycisphaerae bacterium]|nr:type II toxin-antitoxin system VapC family toxin [Phycisphaerae bacterium]HNU45530.1 type II toxin-antitoxin system VapC family toxin [Phycisphaerae bacterium]